MQFKRLDPLANAGPYQRLLKNPVKSFALTEAQYDWINANRPGLVISEGESSVIGLPYRDFLEVHYSFPSLGVFQTNFGDFFDRCAAASSREEAPRGMFLPFRDRTNRSTADTLFWVAAMDQGPEWVEMNLVASPEQPLPEDKVGEGFTLREATAADREAISGLDVGVAGLPPLSEGGMQTLLDNSSSVRLVLDDAGEAVGYLTLASIGGGWGLIRGFVIKNEVRPYLAVPLVNWSIAWLRNNGGRRVRIRVNLNDPLIAALRSVGFAAGETGIDYVRAVDLADVQAKLEERRASGTMIKFGNWR